MGRYTVRNPSSLKGYFGRPPDYLLEVDVRDAMKQTKSNIQASKYLGVCLQTYRKYATQYIDIESGRNLYDLHKSTGRGIKRFYKADKEWRIHKILSGEIKSPSTRKYKVRFIRELIRHCLFEEKCDRCGWDDKRPQDMTTPLLIDFLDGNIKNFKKENIRLLCPNCYSIYVGDVMQRRAYPKSWLIKDKKDEEEHILEKENRTKKVQIDYKSIDLDKPLSSEELDNIDLSKL